MSTKSREYEAQLEDSRREAGIVKIVNKLENLVFLLGNLKIGLDLYTEHSKAAAFTSDKH